MVACSQNQYEIDMKRVKAKYKAIFRVWFKDKDDIVELDDWEHTILLPSIHPDYIALKAIPELQKKYCNKIVENCELIRYEKR
jgi:hypothetical protein